MRGESRWPATVAVLIAALIYLLLPNKLTVGPNFVVPALELGLLVVLMIANPTRLTPESRDMRFVSIGLIALVNIANFVSLYQLVHRLLDGGNTDGRQLIVAAVGIWLTQIIVFGLWYWELDRGGPYARSSAQPGSREFLFAQDDSQSSEQARWRPQFIDYLYVSLTNSTAFSPTDALPLTGRVKLIMGAQSLASLATVAIVGARAVNILK